MTLRSLHFCGMLALVLAQSQTTALAQSSAKPIPGGEEIVSPEDERERQIVERFVTLLEKNPRRGTALDRVYGFQIERGTIDPFLQAYRDRVAKDSTDGVAWLILGLFESQRGRDAAAVTALREAEKTRPTDPLPSYYLGQALVLVGQPAQAAEAFERAIARKPTRADLLEIYQALGRSYQRTRQNDRALAVWNRLEAQFPNDLRVKEQIADALAEESQFAQALPRYESLATAVKDQYRQVQFRIEAAEIKVRLARTADALTDFEGLLGQLNPDSWLYREVRRKIEEVFLKNDDLPGLAAYYERWVKKTPDDIEALARLGRTLASLGRGDAAREWLEKAVKLAPSRRELRLALIDQWVQENKFAEAAKQYEALSEADPKNLDIIREWGRVLLKDEAKPIAERRAAATAVWHRLTNVPTPDPLVVAQIADMFRQAEMTEEAIALYKKAIDLAPDSGQYREYLGEYYHTLKRSADALATWDAMAAAPRRDAKNLARLGEVLAGFGYRQEAATAYEEACRLDDDELDLRLKYADVLIQLERYAQGLAQLALAEKLATSDEEGEAVLERQIKAYQGGNQLKAQADGLRKELDAGREPTVARWLRLARYLEVEQQLAEAATAVRRAIEVDPKSVLARVAGARIFEMGGDLATAATTLRELTVLDRRARSEYLASLAKLEARLGRREQALAAGRELLAAAPGNVDSYQTFADLCFQLGEVEEGLEALRRSVRANPADPKVALALAEALAQQFRTDEAIELYWRSYEKTSELDGKFSTVARLTELYLQRNQFDRLVARLERLRQDPETQREGSLCLAQAYTSSGDLGTARQELERLLAGNTRDAQVITQLSSLSESEGDLTSAAKYQKQLVDLTPTEEASIRLAQLYVQAGETTEAEPIWERLSTGGRASTRTLQAIDSLLAAGNQEEALKLTERLIRKRPEDWEALVREGLALTGLDRPAEAARRFQSLLDLRANDDDPSVLVKARLSSSTAPTGAMTTMNRRPEPIPIMGRTSMVYMMRALIGMDAYRILGSANSWYPADYGQARMLALAALWNQAQKAQTTDTFQAERRAAWEKAPGDPRAAWDWYYLQMLKQDSVESYEAAKLLASRFPSDPSAQWAFLSGLGTRLGRDVSSVGNSSSRPDTTPPLAPADVDLVLASIRSLRQRRPDWVQGSILSNTLTELKRAQRLDEETRIYREVAESAGDSSSLLSLMQVAGDRGDVETLLKLIEKYDRLAGSRSSYFASSFNGPAYALMRAANHLANAKSHRDIPKLLDHFLLSQRRQRLSGKPTRSSTASATLNRSRYIIYNASGTLRSTGIDFPNPNTYLNQDSLSLLRAVYEIFKRDDLVSDLVTGYRARSEKADSDAERIEVQLILSALSWWEEEKERSAEELTRALELAKGDAELRFLLTDLQERLGDRDEALSVIEGVEALDNNVLQRRETTALRLAAALGNIDRARVACDRLFGLRLDVNSQASLASQMHQLGMHEQAEAVLARTSRRAGQQLTTLLTLMSEYQRQNKLDLAVQVAHQILRRGTGRRSITLGYRTSDDTAREEAVRVLARSGKLAETIARVEAQAARSPKSMPIQQTLADYYRASNQREKLRATYQTMAALKPNDARNRFQVGSLLYQAGDSEGAVEQFRVALAKDAMILVGGDFSVVQSAFLQAKKPNELFDLLESMDTRALVSMFSYGSSRLAQDPKSKDRWWKLFRKVWDASPEQRNSLLRTLGFDESIWVRPEAYDLARQATIPTASQVRLDPWFGLSNSEFMYQSGRRIMGLATRLLMVANQTAKLPDLSKEIDEKVKELPQWMGGKVLLAVLWARQGRVDEAKSVIKEKLLDVAPGSVPMQVRWIVAQELEDLVPATDLVIGLYERELKDYPSQYTSSSSSPIVPLADLYQRTGRIQEARALVLKQSGQRDFSMYSADSAAGQKALELGTTANQLLDLGARADAVRLYGEMMAAAEAIPAGSMYYPNRETVTNQANQGFARILKEAKTDSLEAQLEALLEPAPDSKPETAAVDLGLLVYPHEIAQAKVFSLLDETLAAAGKLPEVRAEAEKSLESFAARASEDLATNIALTLASLAGGDSERMTQATKRLMELVERTPLDALPNAVKANARQRAEAAKQLGLWLVARACWKVKVEALRERGDFFAARALEAARRQSNVRWHLAMLREQGQVSLDQGDRTAAEAHWSKMLDLILVNTKPADPRAKTGRPAPGVPGAGSAPAPTSGPAPAPAPTPRPRPRPAATKVQIKKISQFAPASPAVAPPAPPGVVGGSTVIARPAISTSGGSATSERFEQATQVARLAADHGMPALSLRAIREALQGGPPIAATTDTQSISPLSIRSRPENSPAATTAAIVETQVAALFETWRSLDVSSLSIYETLSACVLPKARPAEVHLYPRSILANRIDRVISPGQVRSVGMLLVQAAVDAERVDELRQAIETRRSQPTAEPYASVLLAQLAIASGDEALAVKTLGELETRLQRDVLQNSAELACHAALPALKFPALAAPAALLLERATKNLSGTNSPDRGWELQRILAQYLFSKGEEKRASKALEDALAASELEAGRYAGQVEYVLSRRNQAYYQLASEYDLAGRIDDALEFLGRCYDVMSQRTNSSTPALSASLVRQLTALPAADRYAKLKAWTIPTGTAVSARLAAGFLSEESPPSAFGTFPTSPSTSQGFASTIGLLIDAAKEQGKLDELGEILRAATEKKVENAEPLSLLVEIARGRGTQVAARLSTMADEVQKAVPSPEEALRSANIYMPGQKRLEWTDYLLVRACLEDPQLFSLGERMANDFLKLGNNSYQTFPVPNALQTELITWRANRASGQKSTPPLQNNLKHWTNSPPEWSSVRRSFVDQRGDWFAYENHLGQAGVGGMVQLAFPLTGSFEFSVDAYLDATSVAFLAYGGTQISIGSKGQGSAKRSGSNEQVSRYTRYVKPDAFNHLTLGVDGERLRFLVNGHLFHEQARGSESSPWIRLGQSGRVVYRNPKLAGSPVIPRSIPLTPFEALEGWSTTSYGETRPLSPNWTAVTDAMSVSRPQGQPLDWSMRDDEILGRCSGASWIREFTQSRLVSDATLHDGSSIRYQFFYEPDRSEVHPALGRLAFLLEPDGVKLHWMTASNLDNDWTGIAAANRLEEPDHRRGPERLPLKAKDWNAVQLTIKGGMLKLELNETLIHERPLDQSQNRVFGLYHDKGRAEARVRSVVLEGDWPNTPPLTSDELLATVGPVDEATRRFRHAVLDEATLVLNAGEVLRRSRELPPAPRYTALSAWVLPSADRPTFRLQGDFTPSPNSEASGKDPRSVIESPALELVAVAKELGELNALADRVTAVTTHSDHDRRGQLVLLSLIRAGQGREAEVVPLLEELRTLVAKIPNDTPEWQRWPELIAVVGLNTKVPNGPADSILETLANFEIKPGAPVPRWLRHARHLRSLANTETGGGADPSSLWKPVTRGRAQTHGEGDPEPVWTYHEGQWSRTAGDADASLEFAAPLRPPFEVELEFKSTPTCLTQVGYAGLQIGFDTKGEKLHVTHSGLPSSDIPLTPPLETKGPWHALRLVVRPEAITAFLGDRKVFEKPISAQAGPWLSIHSAPHTAAMVRAIKLTGTPEIPRVVSLSESAVLEGWSSDYYQEATTGANAAWEKRGDEISGALQKPIAKSNDSIRSGSEQAINPATLYALPGSYCESLLQYRRPLLGDDEVEYDFFYEPGKAIVHPAIGRLAFLLSPNGVKVHRLTDAQYERTGLRPENAVEESANRRGPASLPLKPRAWNRVKLALSQNRVTLQLNDVPIVERPLETDNARIFGLFHYADESQARVRRVQLQGHWPTTLSPAN